MQRREFVKKTSVLTLGLGLGFNNIKKWYSGSEKPFNIFNTAAVSDELQSSLQQLLDWMKGNGWTAHLQQAFGINLGLTGDDLRKELLKEIDTGKLNALRHDAVLFRDKQFRLAQTRR